MMIETELTHANKSSESQFVVIFLEEQSRGVSVCRSFSQFLTFFFGEAGEMGDNEQLPARDRDSPTTATTDPEFPAPEVMPLSDSFPFYWGDHWIFSPVG